MRQMIIGLAALLVCTSSVVAQEKRMTEEQRRELEQKLEGMRQEIREQERAMRELERQLGRERARVLVSVPDAPLAFAIESGRPRLGVIVKTDRDAATDSIGAVLDAVTPDGPAAKAGLQTGDIVVTFEGERLGNVKGSAGERLIDLAGKMTEGDTVRIAYRRGNETKTAVIVPKVLDDFSYAYAYGMADSAVGVARRALERAMVVAPRAAVPREAPNVWAVRISERWSEMELTTLDQNLGGYFGTTEGLLVVRAPKDSLLGLKSGDVILRIGGRVPSSPSHAMRIFRSYDPGDEVRVDVMRDKVPREVKAIVPQPERGLFWEEKQ